MIRKLKIVGALAAVVAMYAMTTSAAHAQFTSAAYPATITGSSTADAIDMFGTTVKCTEVSFSGTIVAASSTQTITAKDKKCTGGGVPTTVDFTSCDYVLHKILFPIFSRTSIVCSKAGDSIDIYTYSTSAHTTGLCHISIPAQTEKTGFTLSNTEGGTITMSGSVGGITATQSRTNAVLCPPGTHTETATYTIQAGGIKLSGNNGAISVD